jgi:hypothetical protein
MAVITVGELLDRALQFELRIEQYYADVRDKSANNGVRLLTYYLARHRQHQELALRELSRKELERLRKVEMEGEADLSPLEQFPLLDTAPSKVSGSQLLEAALRYDGALAGLYRSILGRDLSGEARDALQALIRIEERDMMMLKKMVAMHYF